jgi:SAM-dependent methyltransferase
MTFRRTRLIEPEILDEQTPEQAAPSLRDLVRINKFLGGHEVLRQSLRRAVGKSQRFHFLDVGAGSGDAADIVRSLWPEATTVSLDYRLHHVRSAPGARVVGDAFQLPVRAASFDVVYCGLFLHHFTDESIVKLLAAMREASRQWVIVNDLERHVLAYWFLPATRWLFGWDPITLHDGPISVQAAFTATELKALAMRAGLASVQAQTHRPAFRVSLRARVVADDKLRL